MRLPKQDTLQTHVELTVCDDIAESILNWLRYSTFVLHAPLQLDNNDFAGQLVQERLWVYWHGLQRQSCEASLHGSNTGVDIAAIIRPTAAMLARSLRIQSSPHPVLQHNRVNLPTFQTHGAGD